MKKLISIALAAVMLAAASVPAFAANPITKETDNTGTAIVKTSTKTGPDAPEDDAVKYTVTNSGRYHNLLGRRGNSS